MSHEWLRRAGGLLSLTTLCLFPVACVVDGEGAGGGGTGGSADTGTNGAEKVGVACGNPEERNPYFGGYKITEDVIIQGAPECGTGVCLVNHFQGEVACPLGQAAPVDAQGLQGCVPELDSQGLWVTAQGSCNAGDLCVEAGSLSPACDSMADQNTANQYCLGLGAGGTCGASGFCECITNADCAFVTDAVVSCDPVSRQCVTFACHKPGDCQDPAASAAGNAGKSCCLPGTDKPVTKEVCGQCTGGDGQSTRDAESAVYCTCRCGVADGDADDPDYPFCACPDGFECSEIRKNLGLGDANITGKYCIKPGTAYDPNQDQCGFVDGHWSSSCAGVASGN